MRTTTERIRRLKTPVSEDGKNYTVLTFFLPEEKCYGFEVLGTDIYGIGKKRRVDAFDTACKNLKELKK